MEHIFIVEDVAELKTVMPGSAQYVQLAAHTKPGDGGDGLFRWTSGKATANNGTIIGSTVASGGHWRRIYSGPVNVRWFGARGDGTEVSTEIQHAINTVAGGGTVLIPAGSYRLKKNLQLP